MSSDYSRKEFLKNTTVTAAALAGLTRAMESIAQGRTLRIGFVGVGDRGSYHLDSALAFDNVEVPALCDINATYLYRAKRWVEETGRPAPRLYDRGKTDFQRLCDDEELDLVICCTSWRWHAPVSLAAMRTGKNAVSEVPIIQTVEEAWELVETWESVRGILEDQFKGKTPKVAVYPSSAISYPATT